MKQIDKDRFHSKTMARSYDEMCQLLVPGYGLMQNNINRFSKI
jgi:hypothetical protein